MSTVPSLDLDSLVQKFNAQLSPFVLGVASFGTTRLPVVVGVSDAVAAKGLTGTEQLGIGYVSWTLFKKAGLAPRILWDSDVRVIRATEAFNTASGTNHEQSFFKLAWKGGVLNGHTFVHPVWATACLMECCNKTRDSFIQALAGSLAGDLSLAAQIVANYDSMNKTSSSMVIHTLSPVPPATSSSSTNTDSSDALTAAVANADWSFMELFQTQHVRYKRTFCSTLDLCARFVSEKTGLPVEMAQCLASQPSPEDPENEVTPAQLSMLLAGLHIGHEKLAEEELRAFKLELQVDQLKEQLKKAGIKPAEPEQETDPEVSQVTHEADN